MVCNRMEGSAFTFKGDECLEVGAFDGRNGRIINDCTRSSNTYTPLPIMPSSCAGSDLTQMATSFNLCQVRY